MFWDTYPTQKTDLVRGTQSQQSCEHMIKLEWRLELKICLALTVKSCVKRCSGHHSLRDKMLKWFSKKEVRTYKLPSFMPSHIKNSNAEMLRPTLNKKEVRAWGSYRDCRLVRAEIWTGMVPWSWLSHSSLRKKKLENVSGRRTRPTLIKTKMLQCLVQH